MGISDDETKEYFNPRLEADMSETDPELKRILRGIAKQIENLNAQNTEFLVQFAKISDQQQSHDTRLTFLERSLYVSVGSILIGVLGVAGGAMVYYMRMGGV